MAIKKSKIIKFHKYPINSEFGIYRFYKIPFNETVFENADKLMSVLPKTIKENNNISFESKVIKSFDNEDINIYIFEPKNIKTDKVLLFIHGGGFVYRGSKHHYDYCAKIAEEAFCKVIYVDYRLAYRYKYPIPLEDCFAAYKYILENENNKKIILSGDSAGGCLVIDTVRKAKENNIHLPDYLMLLYPVLDKRMNTESMKKYTDTPVWNSILNKKMWELYLDGNTNYISPRRNCQCFIYAKYIYRNSRV